MQYLYSTLLDTESIKINARFVKVLVGGQTFPNTTIMSTLELPVIIITNKYITVTPEKAQSIPPNKKCFLTQNKKELPSKITNKNDRVF